MTEVGRFGALRVDNIGQVLVQPAVQHTAFIRHRTVSLLSLAVNLATMIPAVGCDGSQPPPIAELQTTEVTNKQPSATSTEPDEAGTYIIGPGDQLYVFVYDLPQLSMEVPVRPDGRISTPLIAELVAAGKTPSQLAVALTERLKEFVREPNVTVIVRSFIGPLDRQVRVIGEAAEPQALAYRDHMTLLDVMIMTKGLTRYAAGNRAIIVRRAGDREESIRVRLNDLLKDGDISQNVEVRPGDTLIIPQSWF